MSNSREEASTIQWLLLSVILATMIIALPLVVVWGILNLPSELRIVATICIVVVWGVASGYKDWVISKRKESTTAK